MKKLKEWRVVCAYDCVHGCRGYVVSSHDTYDRARRNLQKVDGNCGWLAIKFETDQNETKKL